jgi:hypothetical protein
MLALVDDQAEFDPDFINRFLDSRSWLIRSMAYLLLGEIPSQDYHDRLIKEFQKTHQEYDKLLIIYAFKQGFGQNVFDLLKKELISTESERIKAQIIETTKASKDKTALIQWLLKEQSTIENKILSDVLDVYSAAIASPAGSAFFNRLFQSKNKTLINLINEEILFQALFDALEDEGINNDLAVVERAASADAVIGKDWRAYADRRKVDRRKKLEQEKREEALINEVLPEYNALLEKFLEDTKKLFGDAGMRPDEVEDSTATIKELLELTTKEASK